MSATACSISPVFDTPTDSMQGRYHDCRRASKDYCRDALGTSQDEMGKCVASATYKCVADVE